MIKKLIKSLKRLIGDETPTPTARRSPVPAAKPKKPAEPMASSTETTELSNSTRSLRANGMHSIESLGPGKNVLIKNRYVREDTGTHETLKILDDSILDTGEEGGIDPYNTGAFDRSKNWTTRTRK